MTKVLSDYLADHGVGKMEKRIQELSKKVEKLNREIYALQDKKQAVVNRYFKKLIKRNHKRK